MDLFFGIDIASENFVVYNPGHGHAFWQNKAQGIKAFLKTLPAGAILAMEATGGYGNLLAHKAHEAGFTVYVLKPVKVKRFRQAGPNRGKSDRIDAQAIQEYIAMFHEQLHPFSPLGDFEARLRKASRVRSGLVAKMASLRKQLRDLGDDAKLIERVLKGLSDRVLKLNAEIEEMLAGAPDAKVIFTIPAVKAITVSSVLPALRTIPFKSKYALDSFAGMDLRPNESGKFIGRRRMSKEGDKHIRRALYMAAMSAIRTKAWRGYYRSLLEEKKLKKIQAINALARKILHTIYGVYKSQTPFIAIT